MYIDIIIVVVLLLLSIFVYRRFSSFVYAFAIIDLFLRIMNFLVVKIPIPSLSGVLPTSIEAIMAKYTKGMLLDVLIWLYVVIYIIFLGYTIVYFSKKKK